MYNTEKYYYKFYILIFYNPTMCTPWRDNVYAATPLVVVIVHCTVRGMSCDVLTHGHAGQLPGALRVVGPHANLCMLYAACFLNV